MYKTKFEKFLERVKNYSSEQNKKQRIIEYLNLVFNVTKVEIDVLASAWDYLSKQTQLDENRRKFYKELVAIYQGESKQDLPEPDWESNNAWVMLNNDNVCNQMNIISENYPELSGKFIEKEFEILKSNARLKTYEVDDLLFSISM